jgi:hypothetical protein
LSPSPELLRSSIEGAVGVGVYIRWWPDGHCRDGGGIATTVTAAVTVVSMVAVAAVASWSTGV